MGPYAEQIKISENDRVLEKFGAEINLNRGNFELYHRLQTSPMVQCSGFFFLNNYNLSYIL